jgi:hypothetical protein
MKCGDNLFRIDRIDDEVDGYCLVDGDDDTFRPIIIQVENAGDIDPSNESSKNFLKYVLERSISK